MDLNFNTYIKNKLSPNLVKTVDDLKFYGNKTTLPDESFVKHDGDYRVYNIGGSIKQHYKINNYNFRGKFDFLGTRQKIGLFGCSFTFGELVDDGYIFSDIIENKSGYNCFNFGVLGSSIEYIAYTFNAASSVIDFDKAVIITFPDIYRSIYLQSNTEDTIHRNISHSVKTNYKKLDDAVKMIYMLPEEVFVQRAIANINWIVSTAKQKGIQVFLTSWNKDTYKILRRIFPDSTLNEMFPYIDYAADNLHPGLQSHQKFAEQVMSVI